jgi:translation initiation factor 3 subunit A
MPSLEQFIMNASRQGDVAATIDHSTKAISFAAPAPPADRLSQLAICLHNAMQYINPKPVASRAEKYAYAIAQAEEERKVAAQRRQIVIKRRELMEEANLRREKEESTAKAERAKALAEETARREKDAAAAAARDEIQRQIDASKKEEARKLAEQLSAQGGLKVDMTKIDELGSDELLNLHVEQLAKEKKDLAEKLRLVGKRVDHMERAYRKEERGLLAEDYERQKTQDRESHEALIKSSREEAIAKQKYERELKNRLARMMPDYEIARQAVASQNEKEFQESKAYAQKKITEEKAKFKEQLLARKQAEKQKREKERKRQEDEERRQAGKSFFIGRIVLADNHRGARPTSCRGGCEGGGRGEGKRGDRSSRTRNSSQDCRSSSQARSRASRRSRTNP